MRAEINRAQLVRRKASHVPPQSFVIAGQLHRSVETAPLLIELIVAALDQQLLRELVGARRVASAVNDFQLFLLTGDHRRMGLVVHALRLLQPGALAAFKTQRDTAMAIGVALPGGDVVGAFAEAGDANLARELAPLRQMSLDMAFLQFRDFAEQLGENLAGLVLVAEALLFAPARH